MKHILRIILAVLVLSPIAGAQPIGVSSADRVVFFGDRLVWPARFSQLVENFVRVRYPESNARYWHVGTRKFEKIEILNERFEALVAPLKPTIVVLSFGLADGDMKPHSDRRISQFCGELELLLDRCKSLGAKVFLVTPPCPTIAKKNILSVNKYDVTVAKIAEAMQRVAEEKGATVVDWYGLTAKPHADGQGATMTDKDGMYPSELSSAIAAKALMDAWNFEPVEMRIDLDWKTMSVKSSHGTVRASKTSDDSIRLEMEQVPIPFAPRRNKKARGIRPACAEYFRMILKVSDSPEGTYELHGPAKRRSRRPTRVPARALSEGLDLTEGGPLLRADALKKFVELVEGKNKAFGDVARFREQYLESDRLEPELVESYKTHLKARQQYHEGLVKILARTPRVFDYVLEVRRVSAGGR